MPYASVSEVPDYVPKAKRKQWLEVWNSAHARALKDGKSADEAEASAFAQANAVAGPNAKKIAAGKVSPESVSYTPTAANPRELCGRCEHFIPPWDCSKVDVQAADVGWCQLFEQKESKAMTTKKLEKFIPFAKVDEALRQVWGVVTAEVPDKDREVCDYAKSKPYYEEVIAEMSKATDNQNFFPLRYMHQLDAIGKCIGFEFRDADKEVFMGFKVVDDAKWKLVQDNVLTGFSQGGSVVGPMVADPVFKGCMRYVAKPAEVSLVDNPCLAGAHFAYVKADGTVELRKFARTEAAPSLDETVEIAVRALFAKAFASGKDVLDYFKKGTEPAPAATPVVKGEAKTKRVAGEDLTVAAFAFVGDKDDPRTWKLPLKFSSEAKTKRHIRNALSRFEQTKGIPAGEKDAVRARIVAAAKEHGVDVAAEKEKLATIQAHLQQLARRQVNKLGRGRTLGHSLTFLEDDLGKLRKGMYEVSCLADYVNRLSYLVYNVCAEQEWEKDEDSPLPEMLAENVGELIDTLLVMVREETDELRADLAARV